MVGMPVGAEKPVTRSVAWMIEEAPRRKRRPT
jgi:hypothetical protein